MEFEKSENLQIRNKNYKEKEEQTKNVKLISEKISKNGILEI